MPSSHTACRVPSLALDTDFFVRLCACNLHICSSSYHLFMVKIFKDCVCCTIWALIKFITSLIWMIHTSISCTLALHSAYSSAKQELKLKFTFMLFEANWFQVNSIVTCLTNSKDIYFMRFVVDPKRAIHIVLFSFALWLAIVLSHLHRLSDLMGCFLISKFECRFEHLLNAASCNAHRTKQKSMPETVFCNNAM